MVAQSERMDVTTIARAGMSDRGRDREFAAEPGSSHSA